MTRSAMAYSLPGVLLRAASACARSRDGKHLAFPLEQLLKHLRELETRKSEGTAVIDEFFRVWDTEREGP